MPEVFNPARFATEGVMNLPAASCRVSILIKPLYSPSPYPLPPGERVNEVTL
jgi:hypothetical protein